MGVVTAINEQRESLVKSDKVAAYLDVSVETVQRWSRAPVDPLPAHPCGVRGFRRYRLSEVEAWVERRTARASA